MDIGDGLEGWIGGLVAAAVTLAFTAWWDTRQHRRRQLDDAVTTLAEAQTDFSQAMYRMAANGWDSPDIARLSAQVTTWQLRVGALAGRRVLGVPARIIAPSREGLRATIGSLDDTWSKRVLDVAKQPPRKPDNVAGYKKSLEFLEPLIDASNAQTVVCNAWLHNPWRFAPRRDLSGWAFSKEAREKPLD
jgi:hypothetical protein